MSSKNTSLKLAVFDMEGCLTCDPTVWEIMHRKNGTWFSHGEPYWRSYLAGEMSYDEFARLDVSTWKGCSETMLRGAARDVALMPGCRRLLKVLRDRDFGLALISNGLMCAAVRFASEFGFDNIFANSVVIQNGVLTGELNLDVPHDSKGAILKKMMAKLHLCSSQVTVVGDSVSDIAMFELAGRSIAFCAPNASVRGAATDVAEEQDLGKCIDIFLAAPAKGM